MPIIKRTLLVGGISVNVYENSASDSIRPVACLFLLHGRCGSTKDVEVIAHSVVENPQDKSYERDLMIVTFDHRNHGERLVIAKANERWSADPAKSNETHAIDMYSIQVGTARDVSFLIDFLPSFLFPMGERTIVDWGVAGISLGGHSAWIAVGEDKRISTGIPIIGCPDYLPLIRDRADKSKVAFEPPYFPDAFVALVKKIDPANQPRHTLDGKKILVLSGEKDEVVPWSASAEFVGNLDVGEAGVKRVVVQEGVGHECTPEMVAEMKAFVGTHMLR